MSKRLVLWHMQQSGWNIYIYIYSKLKSQSEKKCVLPKWTKFVHGDRNEKSSCPWVHGLEDWEVLWANENVLISTVTYGCVCVISCFRCFWLCAIPWIVAHQASLSMGFSRQEYWSGLPCPFPGNVPDPRSEPASLMSPALAARFFTTSTAWNTLYRYIHV